ncbi:hypothetical protein RYX36_002863 [Vicia faba]
MMPLSPSSSHHPYLLRFAVLPSPHFMNSTSKTLSNHGSSSVSLLASSKPQVRFNPSESSPQNSSSSSSLIRFLICCVEIIMNLKVMRLEHSWKMHIEDDVVVVVDVQRDFFERRR